jgi:hypothetical protein
MNLLKYKNFESIQQAEKIIINNNIDRKRSNLLITEFQKLGLVNYLGYCFQIIANDGFIVTDVIETAIETFIKIKQNKINLNDITLSKEDNIYDLKYIVNEKIVERILYSFINKWCPSSIRKEVKSKLKEHKYFYSDSYLTKIKHLSEDRDEMLKKGSRYKSADEWIKYLKMTLDDQNLSIKELKSSNITTIYENDDYLIYQPLDFKSYLIPGFQFWCTMQESMFERYLKLNMLILFNKIDKSKSYITYWSDNKIKIFNYKNNSDVIENIPEELRSIIEKYYL